MMILSALGLRCLSKAIVFVLLVKGDRLGSTTCVVRYAYRPAVEAVKSVRRRRTSVFCAAWLLLAATFGD